LPWYRLEWRLRQRFLFLYIFAALWSVTIVLDLVVNDCVLLELKAISSFDAAHDGQILHYLRATRFEVGLLLNFGPRPQFRRFILEGDKKKIRVVPRESAVEALKD
jgi:hypothetical protein